MLGRGTGNEGQREEQQQQQQQQQEAASYLDEQIFYDAAGVSLL